MSNATHLRSCRAAIAEGWMSNRRAGWLVYGPGSAHNPTVTHGRAVILYLRPAGAIEFTKA
jgi:hypothetical protein